MPFSDLNFWQELGKWVAGIFATAATFFGMVAKWHGSRFRAVESDVKELQDKSAGQDIKLATLEAESINAHEDRKEIKDKLDHLINLQLTKSG